MGKNAQKRKGKMSKQTIKYKGKKYYYERLSGVSMKKEMLKWIGKKAEEEECSMADIIRRAIKKIMCEEENE